MNMKILAVVTPSSIYHGFSTRKKLWEAKGIPVSMQNCGHRNVRKHRDIMNGEKYTTLDIYWKFVNMENMRIISSEPKDYLGIPRNWLITSLGLKNIRSSNEKSQGIPLMM